MTSKTVKEIINTEYKDYAMYVIENRAIPCYIDGLKPVHRKLYYSMLTDHKGKKVKVVELSSIAKHGYNHGETSAAGAVVTLSAPWNNHVPLFEAHGNFGSRLIQEAAASRYIFASGNPEINKYFMDSEVADSRDDVDNPEPRTYLPIIPWVLVNGVEGIAVGFACRYLPHKPSDIAKACMLEAKGKLKDKHVIPVTFPGFTGTVEQEDATKVNVVGTVNRISRNTWEISEVPWGFDREQFYNHLVKMEQDNKINGFEDGCDARGFQFIVKMDSKSDKVCANDPIKYFKLSRSYTENYTALDEFGKLRLFDSKVEIVREFVKYRVKKIADKLQSDIDIQQRHLDWYTAKLKFIETIINEKINLQSFANRDALINDFIIARKITEVVELASRLTTTPVYDMTNANIDDLKSKIADAEATIATLTSTDPTELYIERLGKIL